jgi:hypothetical protein
MVAGFYKTVKPELDTTALYEDIDIFICICPYNIAEVPSRERWMGQVIMGPAERLEYSRASTQS